jgi:hypothetical protein
MNWWRHGWAAWDRFWFHPRSSLTLAVIRIATGAMLAYIHVVWLLRLEEFLGPHSLITAELNQELHRNDFSWSYLRFIESTALLVAHQVIAIAVSLCVCLGFLTRLMTPLAWWMTLMVCHRMTGFLFGLDQVVMMLTMYLSLAPVGARLSLDALLATCLRRRFPPPAAWLTWLFPEPQPSALTTVSMRLIQIHLCIVYLFGGLAKLRGEMWWDGSAMWFSAVAYEYQSLDLTWLGHQPVLAAIITHLTVFWETFYCFLVWRAPWRSVMLGMAVIVHGGIALFLGMITFGCMMIVANMAFIEPEFFERLLGRLRPAR